MLPGPVLVDSWTPWPKTFIFCYYYIPRFVCQPVGFLEISLLHPFALGLASRPPLIATCFLFWKCEWLLCVCSMRLASGLFTWTFTLENRRLSVWTCLMNGMRVPRRQTSIPYLYSDISSQLCGLVLGNMLVKGYFHQLLGIKNQLTQVHIEQHSGSSGSGMLPRKLTFFSEVIWLCDSV